MGFFFNRKKKEFTGHPFEKYHTDFHSHFIPGIDDGVKSEEDALRIFTFLQEHGLKKIITTPHVSADYYNNSSRIILSGFEKMKERIRNSGLSIQFEVAAEYMIDDGFGERMDSGDLLSFSDKRLLVELSYFTPHPAFNQTLFELQKRGYRIILAHPERYTFWYENFKKFEELKSRELFFQVNLMSLAGHYGAMPRKIARKLIDAGMVEYLGSDLHGPQQLPVIQKATRDPYFRKITESEKFLNPLL